MKQIMLVCSAGMSTSLLVTKMKEAAEKQNIAVNIWSTGQDQGMKEMGKADVLLVGPQIQFVMSKFEKVAEQYNVKVAGIDPVAYGKIDGEQVLEQALRLIEESDT